MANNNQFDITAKITNLAEIKKQLSDVTVNIKVSSKELEQLVNFSKKGLDIKVNLKFSDDLKQLLDLAKNGINIRGSSAVSQRDPRDPITNNALSRGSAFVQTLRAGGDTGRYNGALEDLKVISQNITKSGDRAAVLLAQYDKIQRGLAEQAAKASSTQAPFSPIFPGTSARGQAFFDRQNSQVIKDAQAEALYYGRINQINQKAAAFYAKQNTPEEGIAGTLGISSTLYQLQAFKQVVDTIAGSLKEASQAGLAFERSAVGIGATIGSQTIRLRNGVPVEDTEAAKLNLAQGFRIQDTIRKQISPLGLSAEAGNAIGQSLTQGFAGTKGFNDEFLGTAARRIGAFTAIADSPLLASPTRFFKDLSDITNQTPQAKNTQLGARLSKVAPDIFTAQTAEEFEKATQVLEKYVTALKASNTALQKSLELQGDFKNLQIDLGESFNQALLPGITSLVAALESPGVSEGLKQLGKYLGDIGSVATTIVAGGIEIASLPFTIAKGLDDLKKAISNFNFATFGPGAGTSYSQQDTDQQKPSFSRRIGAIGRPFGLDVLENASKADLKTPEAAQAKAFQKILEATSALQPGEEVPSEQLASLRSFAAGNILSSAQKTQGELSKRFNRSSEQGNIDFLQANKKAFADTLDAALQNRQIAQENLARVNGSVNFDPDKFAIASERLKDAENKLAEIRVEEAKNTLELVDAQRKLADAFRNTIETTTFGGRFREVSQRQRDIAADIANTQGAVGISDSDRALRLAQLRRQRFEANVQAEALPGQLAQAQAESSLTALVKNQLPFRQSIEREGLTDQRNQARRALFNFQDDATSRNLQRDSSFVSAAAAFGAAGGTLTQGQIPKNLSGLAAQAAFEQAGRALQAFTDSTKDATRELSNFKAQSKLRRFEREAAVISAAQDVTASGGILDTSKLAGLSPEAFAEATKNVSGFSQAIEQAAQKIAEYNQTLSQITEDKNKTFQDLNAEAQKSGNNSAAFQIARNKASEDADKKALEAEQAANKISTSSGETDKSAFSFQSLFNNEKLDSTLLDLNQLGETDQSKQNALQRAIPSRAQTELQKRLASEGVRQAGVSVSQGPQTDKEQQNALSRALEIASLDLEALPLKEVVDTLKATNDLLAGLQALGQTPASKEDNGDSSGKVKGKAGGASKAGTIGSKILGALVGVDSSFKGEVSEKGKAIAEEILGGLQGSKGSSTKPTQSKSGFSIPRSNIFDDNNLSSNDVKPLSKQDLEESFFNSLNRHFT